MCLAASICHINQIQVTAYDNHWHLMFSCSGLRIFIDLGRILFFFSLVCPADKAKYFNYLKWPIYSLKQFQTPVITCLNTFSENSLKRKHSNKKNKHSKQASKQTLRHYIHGKTYSKKSETPKYPRNVDPILMLLSHLLLLNCVSSPALLYFSFLAESFSMKWLEEIFETACFPLFPWFLLV